MIWKPHVTVAAVVEQDGRFLVVEEESEGRVVINQPAGHLDPGEGLSEAVVRETLEETGWQFAPEGVVGLYRWHYPERDITYLRVCFHGHCAHHDPARDLDHGILRALWLTPAELAAEAARLRSPMVLRCIEDYLAGHRYPLAMITDLP
jgi:8-oxo-dGTP pyrophosphatase MutT (NUDIX family)